MNTRNWFEVDKGGLEKLLRRRGPGFIVSELWQNAIDENVTEVNIWLNELPRKRSSRFQPVEIIVEDNSPEGFKNLSHAFTLFAESDKKFDPEKRGRWNLGEKLVLAVCDEAEISTTKGTIHFSKDGRKISQRSRALGSRFRGTLRLESGDLEKMRSAVRGLLSPPNIVTKFNGQNLTHRTPLATARVALLTEIADADGILRQTVRKTMIEAYEVLPGETSSLYEMGIRVCSIHDKWHYNILQKTPLNFNRDNIPASYLREVRIAVFNSMFAQVMAEDINGDWISIVANSDKVSEQAFEHWKNLKFGEKSVAFDPSDMESNKRAVAEGYTVVSGRMMGSGAWENSRNFDSLPPAGKVTPSHKVWSGEGNPNATPFTDWIPKEKWTSGMEQIASYAQRIAPHLIDRTIVVKYCSSAHHLSDASYGNGELIFNKMRLGGNWFEQGISIEVDATLIHELAHERVSDHLSEDYYRELCRLGAKLKALALEKPELFE